MCAYVCFCLHCERGVSERKKSRRPVDRLCVGVSKEESPSDCPNQDSPLRFAHFECGEFLLVLAFAKQRGDLMALRAVCKLEEGGC